VASDIIQRWKASA